MHMCTSTRCSSNDSVSVRRFRFRGQNATAIARTPKKSRLGLYYSKPSRLHGVNVSESQVYGVRSFDAESLDAISCNFHYMFDTAWLTTQKSTFLGLATAHSSLSLYDLSVPAILIVTFVLGAACSRLFFNAQQTRRSRLETAALFRETFVHISTMEEEDIRELFGEIPLWLNSVDYERGGWLNKVVSAAWPYLDEATSSVIVTALDPILQATRPNFLTSLRFERFSFGSVPAKIEAVKVYESTGEGAVEIDLQVFWEGDPDVVLGVRAAQDNLAVPVSLTEIKCKFTLRLIFAPLIGKFPCFGALTIALTEEPDVVFDLRVVGGDITLVPGLAQPLRTYIKALISSYLVWPRCITVPIPGTGYSLPDRERQEEQSGLLHIEVVSHDVLTPQPGELGLEICWPGTSSREEEIVKAVSGGKMLSSKPISLLVMDPRYQVLKLRWYAESVEHEHEKVVQRESCIVLEDLARVSLYNKVAIADITQSWGPITVAAELDPVPRTESSIRKVSKKINRSISGSLYDLWGTTKNFLVKRGRGDSISRRSGSGSQGELLTGCHYTGAKIVQINLRYQSLQSIHAYSLDRVEK